MVVNTRWMKNLLKLLPKQFLPFQYFSPTQERIHKKSFLKVNGKSIEDAYVRFRELKNKETVLYFNKEVSYYNLYFTRCKTKQKNISLFLESLFHFNIDASSSSGEKQGCYVYQVLNGALVRNKGNGVNKEIIFDASLWSNEADYCSIGELRISPNEKYVALAVDFEGFGQYCCLLLQPNKNGTPAKVIQRFPNISSFEWLADDLLLIVANDVSTNRNDKMFSFSLLTKKEKLLFEETDKKFTIHLSKARSGKFMFLCSHSKVAAEVFTVKGQKLEKIWCRQENKEVYVDHMHEKFYALSLDNDGEFAIFQKDDTMINQQSPWEEFVRRSTDNHFINDMILMSDKLILSETDELLPQLTIYQGYNRNKKNQLQLQFPTPCVIEVTDTQKEDFIEFSYTSPILPLTKYHYDTKNDVMEKIFTSVESWNTENFTHQRFDVPSKDHSTKIPVSLFHKKDMNLSNAPMFCHVYGSYGVPVNLQFNRMKAYLLSKGWILMFPHVRGGSERGKLWHNEGKMSKKTNTFMDLRSCLHAMHLKNIGVPSRTALYGKSAGCLPIAWLLNQEAGALCKACILQFPFVSVLHPMLISDEQLTSQEYLEWGNPSTNDKDFDKIQSYCPFENMQVFENDPAIIVQTSLTDDRVPYWIPLQWVAKRRNLLSHAGYHDSNCRLICNINQKGSHFGSSFEENLNQEVQILTFLENNIQTD